tara:strand:- start:28282 stop:28950 length:669 start_codon:yes stop_codon:yes gene_type:complete
MKEIVLIGASSSTCQSFIQKYKNNYNFTSLSRNTNYSDVDDFDILDTSRYLKIENQIDGLVYFPGTINLRPFRSLKTENFIEDFNVNVLGLITALKFYQKQFNKGASVVVFSTVAAKLGMPFHASVSTVKSAVSGLAKSLAAEWSPNVRVNCISPSIFKSEMSKRILSSETMIEKISNNHPMKRHGETNDISSLINFLLSEESSWITGQDLSVDGGMSTLKL